RLPSAQGAGASTPTTIWPILALNLRGCDTVRRSMRRQTLLVVTCCVAASALTSGGYAQRPNQRATRASTYHSQRVESGAELPIPAVSDNGEWMIDEQAKPGGRAPLYLWRRSTGEFRVLHVSGNGGPYPSFHISDDGRRYTYDCASKVICLRRVDGAIETRFSCKNSRDSVW